MNKLTYVLSTTTLALTIFAAPAAQSADFGGFYLGADVGRGKLKLEDETSSTDADDKGTSYGGFGGYRFALGNLLLGIEGRYGDSSAGLTAAGVSLESGRELSVSGLLGYQIAENWLLFGTLGYSNIKLNLSNGLTSVSEKYDGGRASLGAEWAMTDFVHLRATLSGSRYDDLGFPGADLEVTNRAANVAAIVQF